MQHLNHPKRKKKIDEKLFAALAKHGNVQGACKEAGIGRSTYYHWQQDDQEFKANCEKAIRLGKEEINDFAQSRLIRLIEQGNVRAVTYHLSRRHPDYRWPKTEMQRQEMLNQRHKRTKKSFNYGIDLEGMYKDPEEQE